jgi:hypothetical protein
MLRDDSTAGSTTNSRSRSPKGGPLGGSTPCGDGAILGPERRAPPGSNFMVDKNSGSLPFADSFDLIKRMWSMAGFPNVPGPAAMAQFAQRLPQAIPSIVTPTLDVDELDKRIADLRAVEQWLNLNVDMLRTTIQSLEVQRNTIATLRSFGGTVLSAAAAGAREAANSMPARSEPARS